MDKIVFAWRNYQRLQSLAKSCVSRYTLGIRCHYPPARIRKSKQIVPAQLPEFCCPILNREVITAGHQGFESRKSSEQRILALQRPHPFGLQILKIDDRMTQILRQVVGHVGTQKITDQQ